MRLTTSRPSRFSNPDKSDGKTPGVFRAIDLIATKCIRPHTGDEAIARLQIEDTTGRHTRFGVAEAVIRLALQLPALRPGECRDLEFHHAVRRAVHRDQFPDQREEIVILHESVYRIAVPGSNTVYKSEIEITGHTFRIRQDLDRLVVQEREGVRFDPVVTVRTTVQIASEPPGPAHANKNTGLQHAHDVDQIL